MTPEIKILRDTLEEIKEITRGMKAEVATLVWDKSNYALKQADEIKHDPNNDGDVLIYDKGKPFDWHDKKDGSSDEEREWLLETIQGCEEAIRLREKAQVPGEENIETFKRFLETALKLKKAWGMK